MRALGVTFGRTVGNARRSLTTAVVFACFLAVSAILLAFGIEAAEGSRLSLSRVWAQGVSPVLPALVAFLAMGVWSDERASGRIDLLLSVAVRERDYVLGKFAAIWFLAGLATATFLATTLVVLFFVSPHAFVGAHVSSFVLAFFALLLQGMLWSAVSVAFSAMCRRAVTAGCLSLVVLVVLPRAIWKGLMSLSKDGASAFGEMPLDAHIADLATGGIPVGTVAIYMVATCVFLFVATKIVVAYRFVGLGAVSLRLSTLFVSILSLVFLGLAFTFFKRFDPVAEIPGAGVASVVSMRTREILTEFAGKRILITCFMSRKGLDFLETSRLLRLLKRESESVGGARIELRFVDPSWEIGAAERLVRRGVEKDSVVFELDSHMVSLPVNHEFGERLCASAIRRISSPPQRKQVYWTIGHGEHSHDDYGTFGMSNIARDLVREGFLNSTIDLSSGQQIPADCALILVAGARDDFSRAEIGRLNDYLKEGGRLLVLLDSAKSGGVVSTLPAWGIRPQDKPIRTDTTISGTDIAVAGFSDHAISRPLKGSRIVLERPVAFVPSAVAETSSSAETARPAADGITYKAVAQVDSVAVVAAVERGAGAKLDIAIRPTRIVAIGDASFVLNGQLSARASANRDFFLNSVAYLSGSDTYASGSNDVGIFQSGLDLKGRRNLMAWTAIAVPIAAFLLMLVGVRRRFGS